MIRRLGPGLAAAGLAAYWGALALGTQFSVQPPGPLYELWYSAGPFLVGVVLAFAVGVYVGAWLVLVVVASPLAVLAVLQLTGHVAPWHEPLPPLSGWVWWLAACGLPLGLGVVVRRRGLAPAERPA